MRYAAWITKSVVSVAVLALALSAGLLPAEAKGAPPGKGGGRNKDTSPPTISVPSAVTAGTLSASGAVVWFGVYVTDDRDPAPTVTVSPPAGSRFPVGTTTVTVTAADASGNTSTKSFDVTVAQVTLPRTYRAYWCDSYGAPYYAWDITIGADRTISGSGHQTALLLVDDLGDEWVTELPSELSGEGSVSGTVASDGSFQVEASGTYWTSDQSVDESGNLVSTQTTTGSSWSGTPSIHANGSVEFPWQFPGLPHPWSNFFFWWTVVQP